MSRLDVDEMAHVAAAEGRGVRRDLRQTMLSGVALTVPFFITVLILSWVLDMVSNALAPLADLLVVLGPVEEMSSLLVEGIAAALVIGSIFGVGLAAQHGPDTHLGKRIDTLVEDIPGVGSIYTSVERMSDVMLQGDTDSFQEVKLVEFPHEESFALAFLTADSPAAIEDAAGQDDMLTVFVPLAPNPVMGGHLLNLPRDRIRDVDLSVEEGMQAIMTTGIAIDKNARDEST